MQATYAVQFKGQIAEGAESVNARAKFADFLRITDPQMLQDLFSGQAYYLMEGQTAAAAMAFSKQLRALGVLTEVVRETPAIQAQEATQHKNGWSLEPIEQNKH